MMKKPIFIGAGTAIITPFHEDESVNFQKLEELLEFQIKESIDAIIICGTTGEASTLSSKEYTNILKFTVDKVNKRVPVIAGTGSNSTKHAISQSQYAQEIGADAVLVVTPYYNKTSQKGLYEHFKRIAESINIPVILYNVPSRTSININPDTIYELSKISNINAIKECNFDQMLDVITLCGDELNVYTGNDNQVLPCLSLGGLGVISVMANVIPQDTHEMVMKVLAGTLKEGIDLQIKTNKLCNGLFSDVNPIPIKEAMNQLGWNVGSCRLPLVTTSEKNIALIKEVLKEYGLMK
jgi:4-hydroxy-tetrahydrodipicolinate synthase